VIYSPRAPYDAISQSTAKLTFYGPFNEQSIKYLPTTYNMQNRKAMHDCQIVDELAKHIPPPTHTHTHRPSLSGVPN